MEAIKLSAEIKKDGEIKVTGVPFKKGQEVEIIILAERTDTSLKKHGTAGELLKSGIVGMWKDRKDITDSSSFARTLREKV